MKPNVAGQRIQVKLLDTDGNPVTTGTTSVAVEIDGIPGTGGTATHISGGKWEYLPVQGDTNGGHVSFEITNPGAVDVLLQVYTTFPQAGDSFSRIGAAGVGLTSVSLIATGLDAIVSTATGMVEIAKAIWDRALTGATHNIPTSAGRRLRQATGIVFDDGTAQAGGANNITLSAGADATDGIYFQTYIAIVGGTGAGQGHHIVAYNGTTKVATVDDDWVVQPDATSEYILFGSGSHEAIEEGTPTAVSNNTITLNSFSPSIDQQLLHHNISIISGTGNRQTRRIIDYNGTTKVATLDTVWDVNPTTASGYWIDRRGLTVNDIWNELLTSSNYNIKHSAGKIIRELKEISGYEGGFIYFDSDDGAAGDEAFENGTLENPVDNMTDLNTLSAILNIHNFKIATGSTVTLDASQEKQTFIGEIWTLKLESQSVSGTTFHGADVSGICTGAIKPKFEDCNIGDVTMPPCHMDKCGIGGTITAGSAGDFFIADNCHSAVAGVSAPIIDFGPAVGDVGFNLRWYSGGIDLRNMGQTGTDKISIEGNGQVIINANCIGGTIAIRGHQTLTGEDAFVEAGGTISDDARFSTDQIPLVNVISPDNGGLNLPYGTEGLPERIVRGDKISFVRTLTNDWTDNRLFFAMKLENSEAFVLGDDKDGAGEIELTGHTYDDETNLTSVIVSLSTTQSTVAVDTYKTEIEARETDGSDPVTPLKFDLEVIIGLIN